MRRNIPILLLLLLPFLFSFNIGNKTNINLLNDSGLIPDRPIVYADSTALLTEIKAFPTAEGGGKNSIGGRGGAVIQVNNATELRNALNETYPRTIIFRTGGNYTASTNWNVPYTSPYVTVAGQTAPGDGVTLKGDVLEAKADHMIFRHFRIRPGDPIDNLNKTSLRIAATGVGGAAPIGNIIADHLSISWGADTNVDVGGIGSGNSVQDVTIQNCMISENISNGYNTLLWNRATNISFLRNLMAHSSARNVRSSTQSSTFEQVNNLLYSNGSNVQPTYENDFDIIGNVWITNPSVSTNNEIVRLESCSATNCPSGANIALTRAYINDNTLDGGPITVRSTLNPYLEGSPIFNNGLTYLPNSQVKDHVIANVGANLHRDSYDTQIINEVINRNGSRNGTASDGIYPTLAAGTAYTDADADGMEDAWETLNGLNPASATDRNNRPASMIFDMGSYTLTVSQSSIQNYATIGYTALEFYLNYLAGDYDKLEKVGEATLPNIELVELKAFPTAHGFGRYSTGGRGGSVIYVTNLNNSGTGSFRDAVNTTGTRNILFNLGGAINRTASGYSGVYELSNSGRGNVTIAGQTARGDGIMIKEGELRIGQSNTIVRYLKFRHGSGATPSNEDALNITSYSGTSASGIIIDHVSTSWGVDENIGIVAGSSGSLMFNVTIQNSIISENKYGTLFNKDTYRISYLNNFHAHNTERNYRANYAKPGQLKFEGINNIFYGGRTRTDITLGLKYTHLNNLYKKSNGTAYSSGGMVNAVTISAGEISYLGSGSDASNGYAYIDGNSSLNGLSEQSGWTSYLEVTPFLSSDYEDLMTPATDLPDKLFFHVGASYPTRDAVDTRLISEYYSGAGSVNTTPVYPSVASGTAVVDTDGDGMPDDFEDLHGLDKNSSADGGSSTQLNWTFPGLATVTNTAGYTNLEMYLNQVDFQAMGDGVEAPDNSWIFTPASGGGGTGSFPTITLTGASTVYYDTDDTYSELGATANDVEDGIISPVVITGTVNTAVAGTYYKYYNVTDSDGNNATTVIRTIIVSQGTIHPTSITVTPTTGTVSIGNTLQVLRYYVPSNATIQIGVWSSSNENIAIVDYGLVIPTGNAIGVVNIRYTANDGGEFAEAVITVTGDINPISEIQGFSRNKLIKTGN